jgi:hypothetical protein
MRVCMRGCIISYFSFPDLAHAREGRARLGLDARLRQRLHRLGIEVCFCASFLAQTKKERGATSGLIQKAAVQISLM